MWENLTLSASKQNRECNFAECKTVKYLRIIKIFMKTKGYFVGITLRKFCDIRILTLESHSKLGISYLHAYQTVNIMMKGRKGN